MRATPEANYLYQSLTEWARRYCPSGNSACLDEQCRRRACGHRASRNRYLACLPSDDCGLAGGDCEAAEACTALPWVATYRRQTLGAEVGEACDPENIECVDGALYLAEGAGPVCREVCTLASDCQSSFAPCSVAHPEGLGLSIGVCSLDCPDADADGPAMPKTVPPEMGPPILVKMRAS